MRFPYGETVTRLKAGEKKNALGDLIEDWKNPTQEVFDGVVVFYTTSDETNQGGRDFTDDSVTLLLPVVRYDLTARERWIVRSLTYEVAGTPFPWKHPMSGWSAGTQVRLVKRHG